MADQTEPDDEPDEERDDVVNVEEQPDVPYWPVLDLTPDHPE